MSARVAVDSQTNLQIAYNSPSQRQHSSSSRLETIMLVSNIISNVNHPSLVNPTCRAQETVSNQVFTHTNTLNRSTVSSEPQNGNQNTSITPAMINNFSYTTILGEMAQSNITIIQNQQDEFSIGKNNDAINIFFLTQ